MLLDLTTALASAFSSFLASLLSSTPTGTDDEQLTSQIIVTLRNIVQDRLAPSKDGTPVGRDAETTCLAREIIRLLECLSWRLPEESEEQCVLLPLS